MARKGGPESDQPDDSWWWPPSLRSPGTFRLRKGPKRHAIASLGNRTGPDYGGAPENDHYSSLKQINRSNVSRLAVAWSFDTGEEGGLQTSPLEVGGVLYGITPTQKVFVLDAEPGDFSGNLIRAFAERSRTAGWPTGPTARTSEFSWAS